MLLMHVLNLILELVVFIFRNYNFHAIYIIITNIKSKGAAFTRFQTLRIRKAFPNLADKLISYGSCQFPTLGNFNVSS
jgi:hypothetical protein